MSTNEPAAPPAGAPSAPPPRRITTTHSVVRFTVIAAAPPCPVFHQGDVFYVRQHVIDTEFSPTKNFCFHTLAALHKVFERVRRGPVGGKETFACRDKGMVQFEVERLPDETASIGRAGTPPAG